MPKPKIHAKATGQKGTLCGIQRPLRPVFLPPGEDMAKHVTCQHCRKYVRRAQETGYDLTLYFQVQLKGNQST